MDIILESLSVKHLLLLFLAFTTIYFYLYYPFIISLTTAYNQRVNNVCTVLECFTIQSHAWLKCLIVLNVGYTILLFLAFIFIITAHLLLPLLLLVCNIESTTDAYFLARLFTTQPYMQISCLRALSIEHVLQLFLSVIVILCIL